MRAAVRSVAFIMALVAPAVTLSAQWPKQPTPGVPKGADGQPNMNAAAPRTADGKPDLSGVWRAGGGLGARQGGAPPPADGPPVAGFRDVAQRSLGVGQRQEEEPVHRAPEPVERTF